MNKEQPAQEETVHNITKTTSQLVNYIFKGIKEIIIFTHNYWKGVLIFLITVSIIILIKTNNFNIQEIISLGINAVT